LCELDSLSEGVEGRVGLRRALGADVREREFDFSSLG